MSGKIAPVETYNIFKICQDFGQRIEQLNRLKEELISKADKSEENK